MVQTPGRMSPALLFHWNLLRSPLFLRSVDETSLQQLKLCYREQYLRLWNTKGALGRFQPLDKMRLSPHEANFEMCLRGNNWSIWLFHMAWKWEYHFIYQRQEIWASSKIQDPKYLMGHLPDTGFHSVEFTFKTLNMSHGFSKVDIDAKWQPFLLLFMESQPYH